MSRNSWSSTGSDAEVRHHFDQPFDYDPRLYFGHYTHRESRDDSDQREEKDEEDEEKEVIGAHAGTDADSASLNASHDSFDNASEQSPNEQASQLPPESDYLDDAQDQSNQAICRICLESSSSETAGGESLGRLLSPCRCKGTMKYVHATCLDQWRAASARSSSAVACDQCGAPYRFRKSKFVGLATSPTLLFVVSLFLFLLLIWTVGVVATFCMDLYDRPTPLRSQAKTKSRSWWSWRGAEIDQDADFLPLQSDAWSYLDADYSSTGMWSYSTLMYEPAAYIKLIKEAVRSFASGEAVDAVREAVGLQDTLDAQPAVDPDPREEQGFWSAIKNEWMYGDGGLWAKSASTSSASAQPTQNTVISSDSKADPKGMPVKPKSREKYDARRASNAEDINATKRRREQTANKARRTSVVQDKPQGWLSKLFVQCKLITVSQFSFMGTLLTFHPICFSLSLGTRSSLGRVLACRNSVLRQPSRGRLLSGPNQPA